MKDCDLNRKPKLIFASLTLTLLLGVAAAQDAETVVYSTLEPVPVISNPEISYSAFATLIADKKIASVELPYAGRAIDGVMTDGKKFTVIAPVDRALADRLSESGIETTFASKPKPISPPKLNDYWGLLIYELMWPVLFIAFMIVVAFFVRKASRKSESRADRFVAAIERLERKLEDLLLNSSVRKPD